MRYTDGGTRTRTTLSGQRILSPLRLPFRHIGVRSQPSVRARNFTVYAQDGQSIVFCNAVATSPIARLRVGSRTELNHSQVQNGSLPWHRTTISLQHLVILDTIPMAFGRGTRWEISAKVPATSPRRISAAEFGTGSVRSDLIPHDLRLPECPL